MDELMRQTNYDFNEEIRRQDLDAKNLGMPDILLPSKFNGFNPVELFSTNSSRLLMLDEENGGGKFDLTEQEEPSKQYLYDDLCALATSYAKLALLDKEEKNYQSTAIQPIGRFLKVLFKVHSENSRMDYEAISKKLSYYSKTEEIKQAILKYAAEHDRLYLVRYFGENLARRSAIKTIGELIIYLKNLNKLVEIITNYEEAKRQGIGYQARQKLRSLLGG